MQNLSDGQWDKITAVINRTKSGSKGGGRPRTDDRRLLNGILWVFMTGSQWSQLPGQYGAYVTCWRRYKEWESTGLWSDIWEVYLKSLDRPEQIEWMLAFLDGKITPGKKGK